MEKTNTVAMVGRWAFIIGVVIALVAGFASKLIGPNGPTITTSVLIVMGLIVGLLNVTEKETKEYLLAAAVLVLVTSQGGPILGAVTTVGPYIQSVFTAIMTFVMPAAIIVSLKAIYALAQD